MNETFDIIGLEDFANQCSFTLQGNVLTTRCHLRDLTGQVYQLERSVDLAPAIELVTRNLAAWHAEQHGQDATVSGWTDIVKNAVSTVKKVAQNKTVRSLYEEAKPFLKAAVKEIPGGESAMVLATKAAKTYEKARAGVRTAVKAVAQVKQLAEQGDPKAEFAIKVMQNVKTIVEQKAMGVSQPVLPAVAAAVQARSRGGYYSLGVTTVSGGEDLEVGSFLSKAKWAVPGYAAYRGAKAVNDKAHGRGWSGNKGKPKARDNRRNSPMRPGVAPPRQGQGVRNPMGSGLPSKLADAKGFGLNKAPAMEVVTPEEAAAAAAVPAPLASAAVPSPASVSPSYETTPDLPTDEYMEEEAVEEYYDEDCGEECEEQEQEVSGWMYQPRYRTVSQHLLQSQRSPGVGIAARELYNRGLGRPATSLSQLASEALRSF